MENFAHWLLKMECQAAEFYLLAAHRFAGDPALCKFLKRLAEDESEHYRIMLQIADLFDGEFPESSVSIDAADRRRLESTIQKAIDCCSREEINRTELLEYIFLVEFSELNDIFLYVTNWFGTQRGDCLRSVTEIERHRKVIQHFFESTPEGKTQFQKMRNMQPASHQVISHHQQKVSLFDRGPVRRPERLFPGKGTAFHGETGGHR